MELDRIAELLEPFLCGPKRRDILDKPALSSISIYLDILLRWNARINLTAVRNPEEIMTRHFGESLLAAQHIFRNKKEGRHLIDVGSGAGFPGLPIKVWKENIHVTLIESNHKKATFLREAIRALKLENAVVFAGRAEVFSGGADVVTLRAVERFEDILPVTIKLATPGGEIALLISEPQVKTAQALAEVQWLDPISVPQSDNRVLLIGRIPEVKRQLSNGGKG